MLSKTWTDLSIADMTEEWTLLTVGSNQCVPTMKNGRQCWQMVVAADEPMTGKWGDGLNDKGRKRAQFRSKTHVVEDMEYNIKFATLVEDDYPLVDQRSSIWEVHARTAQETNPFAMRMRPEGYAFVVGFLPWKYRTLWTGKVVPGQWEDWQLTYKSSPTDGYIRVKRNGTLIIDYAGQTMYETDTDNYFLVGPYLWEPDGAVPVDYIRAYVDLRVRPTDLISM